MQKRFHVLDSFRGIAAVFIIVHHLRYTGSMTEWTFFIDAQLFVTMFFVLSGFVLTHTYAFKEYLNFRSFFISRTFRIFPLHIFMLLLFVLSELAKYFAHHYGLGLNHAAFAGYNALENLPIHLLLLQSWIPDSGNIGFNSPSWSISVEYYMYLIFFVTLLLTKTARNIVWAVIFFATLISLIYISDKLGYLIHVIRGLSSFFLGSLVYLLYKRYSVKLYTFSNIYYSIIELSIVLLIIYIVASDIENKSLFMIFLFSLQMFIFAFEKGFISHLLQQHLFLHIGQLSYSIYLIHYFILILIMFAFMALSKLGFPISDIINAHPLYGNITVITTVYLVIYVSHFTYKFIELKWQNIGKKLK